jgi:sterol desaturase/sphingolipid hydroxylase (fatty acid hydroxylase superfamily)
MTLPSMRDWHWPHLLLLALWPAWTVYTVVSGLPASPSLLAWLVFNAALLGAAERWRPHRPDWQPSPAQLRRDGTVWGMNILADGVAGALVASAAIAFAGDSQWPLPLQIAAGIVVAEFGSYWLHRWSHAEGWLWRVHLLHHRPERLNTANALTAHPVNAIYNHLARALPLVVLELDPEAILAVALFGATQSLVTHANVAGSIGWLELLIGSAGLHRLHHSTEQRQAGNFGTTVPLWDQLFGTYRRGPSPIRVGVFTPGRYPGELQLGALLCWPFAAVSRLVPWLCGKCCLAA